MIAIILIFGLLNLAVGFALAVYLEDPARLRAVASRLFKRRRAEQPLEVSSEAPEEAEEMEEDYLSAAGPGEDDDTDEEEDDELEAGEEAGELEADEESGELETDEEAEVPLAEQIPSHWLSILEEHGVTTSELVEATAEVLRLQIGPYHNDLVQIDRKAREALRDRQIDVSDLADDLKKLNESWLAELEEAQKHLDERIPTLGEDRAHAERLLDLLDGQGEPIQDLSALLASLDMSADPVSGWRAFLHELRLLFGQTHQLRDTILATLVEIKKSTTGLAQLDKEMATDELTGLTTRGGLEKMFVDFFAEDPHHQRQLSCVMMDLDKFGDLLEQRGPVVTDRVLAAFASLFNKQLRKHRGMDLAVRFGGQRFLAFLADTGPRAAMSCSERIRQKIQLTTFKTTGSDIRVTASCGVTEYAPNEGTRSLFARLEAAVLHAKQRGGNSTALDEGEGPDAIDPPQYRVEEEEIYLR